MNLDLAIIGQGAVSPAGIGPEALCKNQPAPMLTAEVRRPEQTWPVLRVDLQAPELLRWQREPRLRRASPLTLFLIETAEQALAGVSPEERAQTGLVIALSAGCLAYSRRFFEGFVKEGRHRASPALFPETVFNSPGSHVASALKLNGAVYALVGDESAWVGALQTAAVWLREERVSRVLVLGGEEFDPISLDAYRSANWLRRSRPSFLPSEGAGGVLLRRAEAGDIRVISTARDGFIYRNPREAALAAERLFQSIDPALPCCSTAEGTWLRDLEKRMLINRARLSDERSPYLGEAFTASAAWNTLRAANQLSSRVPALALPIWGLNHQLSVVELHVGK